MLQLHFLLFLFFSISFPAISDDTQALRNAVKCLCEGNDAGGFSSCCASYSNGASITLSKTQCFITSLSLFSSDTVLELFVLNHFNIFNLISVNMGINNKGLTFVPDGCFSSLTQLQAFESTLSIFSHHFPLFHTQI